jgi:epoxyqueuosine reductase
MTVRRAAIGLDFALLGIAPASLSDYASEVTRWLEAGKQGQMSYMNDALAARLDPTVLVPGARSVICVADRYADSAPSSASHVDNENREVASAQPASPPPQPQGKIARYAWGDDYHRLMKKRLHKLADQLRELWPEHTFLTTVDTAPILEREQAVRAGLGWIAKNAMLISPSLGSYLLLGEIVTTLDIQTDAEAGESIRTDHCGSCTRCIDACPTQCIEPRTVNASRCVSYLTLEHRTAIDPSLHPLMGDWIAGCDVCQEVCPFNQQQQSPASTSPIPSHPAYQPRPPAPSVPLLQLLNWTAADRQRAFERSALKRVKLEMLKRNALIAAGNHLASRDDAPLLQRIQQIAASPDEHELVRQTAQQVLTRLHPSQAPHAPPL